MFTCEAYYVYVYMYANLPLWHMSQVNLNMQFDISQKIFQHIRTNFESLSTIEPFLKISAHSNHFLISQHIRTCVIVSLVQYVFTGFVPFF